ncbi:MAG: 5-bromo-4-chloroindolyl phosphate hydrolysis family protein [Rhodobacterales bacterium]|jgi:hypothetical protein|nr:5-bromo-4-chloroindolyl phosphate hydrolysis family protein [Rhodobacterales bacterium]
MSERFGGKYSPGGDGKPPTPDVVRDAVAEDRAVDAAGAKANLLFVPPLLIAFLSFGKPVTLAVGLVAAGTLTLAAWLLRDGLRAEAAYNARTVARRPALPRKMLASALTGIGVALTAWTGENGIVGSVIYGVVAAGLHVAAFGIDPLKDKRMEGIDTFQQDRVARVVTEAEGYLSAMKDHISTLNDRALDMRVTTFQALARKMIRTVEEDPRDLTEARKFLTVYLMGARDATVKFVDIYKRTKDEKARADYEALLTDLETNFSARTEKLLEGGKSDMDIEIKVLRDRLQREGIRSE